MLHSNTTTTCRGRVGSGMGLCSDNHRENWSNSATDSLGAVAFPDFCTLAVGEGLECLLSLELILSGLGSMLHLAKFSVCDCCH